MAFENQKEGDVSKTEQLEIADDVVGITPADIDYSEDFKWDFEIIANLAACVFTYFSAILSTIIPASGIGFVIHSFPAEASDGIWIIAAFTVSSTVIQSFDGALSDRLGRKGPFLAGQLISFAGTLISGRATSMRMVIGGQVLTGIGATLGFLAIPLIQEIVPRNQRAKTLAYCTIFPGLAASTGGIISGAFINSQAGGEFQGWRGGYYLLAGCFAISALLIIIFYHPAPRPNPENQSMTRRILEIDWTGVGLIAVGLTLFLFGLQSADNPDPWVSARVLSCVILGAVTLGVYVWWEWKGTSTGILNHRLFSHRNFGVTMILCFVGGMVLFGGQTFLPQQIIYLFTDDAVLTGVWALPFGLGSVTGSVLGALLLQKVKEAKGIVIGTFAALILAAGLMVIIRPGISFAAWFFPAAIMGVAIGAQTSVLQIIVTLAAPDDLIAMSASVSNSMRGLGGSIGVVIFNQVFNSRVRVNLPRYIAEMAIEQGLSPESAPELVTALLSYDAEALSAVPGITPDIIAAAQQGLRLGYSESFKYVWYTLIPFAAVCLGLSFLLHPIKPQLTGKVAAEVRHNHHLKLSRR